MILIFFIAFFAVAPVVFAGSEPLYEVQSTNVIRCTEEGGICRRGGYPEEHVAVSFNIRRDNEREWSERYYYFNAQNEIVYTGHRDGCLAYYSDIVAEICSRHERIDDYIACTDRQYNAHCAEDQYTLDWYEFHSVTQNRILDEGVDCAAFDAHPSCNLRLPETRVSPNEVICVSFRNTGTLVLFSEAQPMSLEWIQHNLESFEGCGNGRASPDAMCHPEGDWDHDAIRNADDNCHADFNPDQSDSDLDGVGDLCDFDRDHDGTRNEDDTHPSDPNRGGNPLLANGNPCIPSIPPDLFLIPEISIRRGNGLLPESSNQFKIVPPARKKKSFTQFKGELKPSKPSKRHGLVP